jgi:cell division protein FtsZ
MIANPLERFSRSAFRSLNTLHKGLHSMLNIRMPAEDTQLSPRLMVIGVGGGGCNAVTNMITSNLQGVEFLVCNSDAQSLKHSPAERKVQLGLNTTRGLGAGARPDIGRVAAEEALDEIMGYLEGCNMAFITAGMGGGTGTGAAPVIARAARDAGILTVGVVTKPFHFEGSHRMRLAEQGIEELQQYVDTLLVIPNQNLFRVTNEKTSFADAFKMADDVLHMGVRGVTDLIVMPGLINLDFADIRAVMSEMGKAMMGTGEATGDRRAVMAAEAAIANPLLEDVSMQGARAMLINITGGMDMTLFEVDEACNRIRDEVDPEANIIFGASFNPEMDGTLRISIVATGIDSGAQLQRPTNTNTANLTGMNVNAVTNNAAAQHAMAATQGMQQATTATTSGMPGQQTTFARSIAQPRPAAPAPRWQQQAAQPATTTQQQNNAPAPNNQTVAQQQGVTNKAQAQTAAFYGRNPNNAAMYGAQRPVQQQQQTQMTAGNTALAYAEPTGIEEEDYHYLESADDAGLQPTTQALHQHHPVNTPVADIQPTTLGNVMDDDHFMPDAPAMVADKNVMQSAPVPQQAPRPQQQQQQYAQQQRPMPQQQQAVAPEKKRGGLFSFGASQKPAQSNVRSQHTAAPQPALIQESAQGSLGLDEDLDIPAFLRRQAN